MRKGTEVTTGVTAAGAASVPQEQVQEIPRIGEYLATHGFGVLSWGEVIQIIGALYIVGLGLHHIGFFRGCKWLINKILERE